MPIPVVPARSPRRVVPCSALVLCVVAFAALAPRPARAAAPLVRLSCRPAAAPGRVSCELEIEVAEGRLAWADALVVRAPPFARPLRARVSPRQASQRLDRRVRLPISLAATASGKGTLEVKARSVVCLRTGRAERCTPHLEQVTADVEVGAGED
jgi:hypothetical protein